MSEAFEVSPDDALGVAEAIRRAAAGATVHVVRDGEPVADIVPASRSQEQDAVPDDCELPAAELEAHMARRPPLHIEIARRQAARFDAPTLAHYRAVHEAQGAPWPGEAFIRRHHPVADPP